MKILKNLDAAIFGILMVLVFCIGTQIMGGSAESDPWETICEIGDERSRIAELEAEVEVLTGDKNLLTEEVERYRTQAESLTEDKDRLIKEVEKYRTQAEEECILVLRYEQRFLSGIFGDSIVIEWAVQEIAVNRELYDSCRPGDDITSLELHRLLTSNGMSDTRVIVQNKYIRA